MALPINVDDLINGRTVEWERIEFKEGWNPEDVLHSLCAFANDINNWGGGYIIIGIAEKDGHPVLPPKGLQKNQIDAIQKKLLEICHLIVPTYFPVAQPIVFRRKHILILWAPGGEVRPYKVPIKLGEKSQSVSYVRRFSNTVRVNAAEEKQLFELAAKIPFDDRIHHQADLKDLKLPLIQSFLQEIGSDLFEESSSIPFSQLCRQMNIARGPDEYLKPVNVGLLFFNEKPEQFFRGAKIEVIEFHDEVGDRFSEKPFVGPVHQQLKDALEYIQKFVLKEEVRKIRGKAKAERFFNYPFEAIKEALANAVYHRSYEHQSSVEVNVRLDCIEILSFPGPVPPVDNALLKQQRVVPRDYRNRRVGDFLKELHLTEGRGTGIPKIRRANKNNGSPEPIFATDTDKTYFLTTLPIHRYISFTQRQTKPTGVPVEVPVGVPVEVLVADLTEIELRILDICKGKPRSISEIGRSLKYHGKPRNLKNALKKLRVNNYIAYTIPDKPRSRSQRYRLTGTSEALLRIGRENGGASQGTS